MLWHRFTLVTSLPLEEVVNTLSAHTERCWFSQIFPWPRRRRYRLRGKVHGHGFTLWLRPTLIGINDYGAVLAGTIERIDGTTRIRCTIGPMPMVKPILIGWLALAALVIPVGSAAAAMSDSVPSRWVGIAFVAIILPLGGLLLGLFVRSRFSQRTEIIDLVKRLICARELLKTPTPQGLRRGNGSTCGPLSS